MIKLEVTRREAAPRVGVKMHQNQRILDETADLEAANRQTASLAGAAVTLALLVVGLFLVHVLHEKVMVEDCLMSGRGNCDAMVSGAP